MPPFYAHTADGPKETHWEPLFTPWHDRPGHDLPSDPRQACSGQNTAPCPHCESLAPFHGHLNKVAHLAPILHAAAKLNLVSPNFSLPDDRASQVEDCFGVPDSSRFKLDTNQVIQVSRILLQPNCSELPKVATA